MTNEKNSQKIDNLRANRANPEADFIYGVNENENLGFFAKIENSFVEKQRVSLKEKSFFFHLFAVLMNAGINTISSLKILTGKTANRKFRRILNTMTHDLEKGESLSSAMEKFPEVFTRSEIGVIKSGEAIGALDKMLTRLAEQSEEQSELITTLKGSLTYPVIVFAVLLLASTIMFGFVIPKLAALFQENGLKLPFITKAFLVISTALQNYWGLIVIAIIALIIALGAYFQTEEGKFNKDLWLLKTPLIGEIFKKVYLVRFFSTLGLLLDAGVPLQETMSIITQVIDNEVYKLKTFEIKARVQTGEPISNNLSKTPFLFPETVVKMVEIGEKSATLSDMSLKISEQYVDEVQFTLKNLTTIIGPIVIVIVGAFVAVFALAILSPVFQLSQGIV